MLVAVARDTMAHGAQRLSPVASGPSVEDFEEATRDTSRSTVYTISARARAAPVEIRSFVAPALATQPVGYAT